MSKRKPVADYPDQDYPQLKDFKTSRRGFLKNLGLGVITLGVGTQLLPSCGAMAEAGYYDARLPATGTSNTYLNSGEYLTFALTMITYDSAVSDYYRGAELDGVQVITQVLQTLHCAELTDPDSRSGIEDTLRQALEDHVGLRIATNGNGIESVSLQVDSCEIGNEAGGMADPDYP